jgi:hypothetical protein
MKFLGITISLSKGKSTAKATSIDAGGKRVTGTIKKQAKRTVSFQVADIKAAEQMALNADEPNRGKLHDIYRYILKDGHLKSQVRTAKYEVLSEPFMLYRDGIADEEASKIIAKRYISHIIEAIIDSEFHGYSVCEVQLGDDAAGVPTRAVSIDREFVSIERQWILLEGSLNGPYLPYGEAMYELDLLEFGRSNDLGTLLECAFNVLWKYFSRSDWSRASEKYGMPFLKVLVNSNDPKELDDAEARAANFGGDGYYVGQPGDDVEIVERKNQRMHDIYQDNVKLCNEEISKIINGQTATTDVKSHVGSAEVQERTMMAYTESRMQMVADEFNEKVIPYLVYKGILSDGLSFDYPYLVRMREKRRMGLAAASDAKPITKEPEPAND